MSDTTGNVIDQYVENYEAVLLSASWRERRAYGQFYQDAHAEIAGVASGTPYPVDWWCRAAAALSPLKSWPQNMKCLWALHNYLEVAGWPRNEDLMREASGAKIGAMMSPTESALRALAWGRYPTGQKTGPFAKNLEGDLTQITIDRHMTRAAGIESDSPTGLQVVQLQSAIRRVASRTAYFPAVTQAIIWGVWRAHKGLPAA